MEIDAESFPHHLLGLFVHISEADFVSFDLELSGIPSRIQDKPQRGPGRLSLEDRYAETKLGADRYQILQVGITCARFDYIANKYVLRPFNFNISPLFKERMDFEREIKFQSGACSFLLQCGFDLGAPFAKGVQYLSREEAARAEKMASDRLDNKNPVPDLQLKKEDVESLDFMRRVRKAIKNWNKTSAYHLDITTHTEFADQPSVPVISRFEKRLVHQLVRAEFPELVSVGRNDCVRIMNLDPVREADNTRRMKNRVKESIIRQTGFRWIFEALASDGDVDRNDPLFAASLNSMMTAEVYDVKSRYDRAIERLKTRKPVIVGHNMFTDIVYFYRTFVGELPDTLQGFREAIHKVFPRIIDTKYLATYAEGDLNASPNLEDIAESLSDQPLPHIVTHADHPKYQDTKAFHEAGYDSLLTATIMIKLAAKLGVERNVSIPIPIRVVDHSSSDDSFKSAKSNLDVSDFVRDGREKVDHPVPLPPVEQPVQNQPKIVQKQTKKKKLNKKQREQAKKAAKREAQRKFQTKNIFDTLRGESSGSSTEEEVEEEEEESAPQPSMNGESGINGDGAGWDEPVKPARTWENDVFQDKSKWVKIEQMERQPMELIPGFDHSSFWSEFGNTLRVFGTEEAVLRIADWKS